MLRFARFGLAACVLMGCGPSAIQSADESIKQRPEKVDSAAEKGIADFPKLSAETDWPWWRGPSRNGIAAASADPPSQWSATENVVWKASVPGRGHASPTIAGDRVYLATADEKPQVQSVLAFDRATGEMVWSREVSKGGFPGQIHSKNTHASPTIACDGDRVFATFFHDDQLQTAALALDGKPLWQTKVSTFRPRSYQYGYAPSPVLYKTLVIIAGECDNDSFISALDRETGKPVWTAPRPKNITYSTPAIAFLNGRDQLFLSGADKIASYDPNSGDELWSTSGIAAATCGTAVWDNGLIFASGGYPKSETLAVKADGSGAAWRNNQKCYEQSMLAVDGHLYALTDNGVFFCWRASDGKEMWKQRLSGPVSASPVYAKGRIYQANEKGTVYVIAANPERFELVAENVLGDESMASPAIVGKHLFLRVASNDGERRETLYCVGAK